MARVLRTFVLVTALLLLVGCSKSATTPRGESGPTGDAQRLQERVRQLEGELGEAKRPISMNNISVDAKQRLLKQDVSLFLWPRAQALVLQQVSKGTVVQVLRKAAVDDDGIWLLVEVPTYSSPTNNIGWVREQDTETLTSENVRSVQRDVYVKAGTPVYSVGTFDEIEGSQLERLEIDVRARIEEQRDGMARLAASGGLGFWVKQEFLIYPDPN